MKKDNKPPIVVVLPSEDIINDVRNGKPLIYKPVILNLLKKGIHVEDMLDAFLNQGDDIEEKIWFARGGHYSPVGNNVIADWLVNILSLDK